MDMTNSGAVHKCPINIALVEQDRQSKKIDCKLKYLCITPTESWFWKDKILHKVEGTRAIQKHFIYVSQRGEDERTKTNTMHYGAHHSAPIFCKQPCCQDNSYSSLNDAHHNGICQIRGY